MTSSFPVRYLTLAYGDNQRVYDQASMLLLVAHRLCAGAA